MKNRNIILTATLSLIICGGLSCTALAATPPPFDVNVVNTPSVTVANTTANPVPVVGTVNTAPDPARSAAQIQLQLEPLGSPSTVTIPAGRIFVIEYVSFLFSFFGTGTATFGADPTTLKIDLDIDMESIYTDNEKVTGHLKTPDFFDVKNNPKSKFTVTKVEKDKEGYKLTGKLDMHGKSKEITMPAKITQTGNSVKLESTFKINRFDWDVNYGKGKVDDNVEIKVKLDGKAK